MITSTTGQGRIRHFFTNADTTLARCIMQNLGFSSDEALHLISFGAVYLERRRTTSDRAVSPGQYVRVHLKPRRYAVDGVDWHGTIVFQDAEFVVANKPSGVPVHETLDNGVENLLNQLGKALRSPLFVTHRLDIEVSGLIVVARTPGFQRQFNRLLAERKVFKRYRALVTSAPETGQHIHFMAPTKRGPKTVSLQAHQNWLRCALSVVKAEPSPLALPSSDSFELEIGLETGRTHQIRAQLSAMGSPIVGDTLYGSETSFCVNGKVYPGIALFSSSCSWMSPDGHEYSFQLPPAWMNSGNRYE